MARPIRILLIGDLHAGHEVGLWPDRDMPMPDGRELPLNSGQQHLLKCWKHLTDLAKNDLKPDILIVNGDLVDGEGRKSFGTEQQTTIISAQVKAAKKLLAPMTALVAETYVIRGTPYHDGARGMIAEAVGEALGAQQSVSGWHTFSVLDLDIEGVIINVQHSISVASGFYRATPLDREGIYSALTGKEGKAPKADAVARSHAHVFVHVEHPTKHIFTVPCWQLQTEYMRRHSAYRMMPDIGAVVLDVDPRAKRRRDDPILLRKVLYDLPDMQPHASAVRRKEEEAA